MSVRTEDYDEIVSRINRRYAGDLQRGDEEPEITGISTGSLELDVAMGGQGIPQGRWTRFYGGYSSSKTLTTYNIIANAQKLGLTCAYYNIEKQYHKEFVERRGVNTKELTIVQGTTVEEIGEKMEALMGVVHVHVVDSCTIAVSEDELTAEIRDWRPGINARAWGKVFRRLNDRFDNHENTVILIDQMRNNFGNAGGGESAAGGKVFDYQSSMSVLFKRSGWLWRNEEGILDEAAKQKKGASGQTEPDGIEIKVRVEKSRVCRPLRTATMRLDLDTLEFDRDFEYVKAAKHYGIVEQTSRGRYEYDPGDGIEPVKFHGDKKLRQFISERPELKQKIEETAIAAAKS